MLFRVQSIVKMPSLPIIATSDNSPQITVSTLSHYNRQSFLLRSNGHACINDFISDARSIFQSRIEEAIHQRGCIKVEIIFRHLFVRSRPGIREGAQIEYASKHINALWLYSLEDIFDYYNIFETGIRRIITESSGPHVHEIVTEFEVYVGEFEYQFD